MIPHVLVDPYRVEVDPFWSSVVLLVTADDAVGATPTDKSTWAQAPGGGSNGVIVTDADGKFGGKSFWASTGDTNRIVFPFPNAGQQVGAASLTYEYWWRIEAGLHGGEHFQFYFQSPSTGLNYLRTTDNTNMGWNFGLGGTNGGGNQAVGAIGTTWHHTAVVRKYDAVPANCQIRWYQDGGLVRTNSGWGTGAWNNADGITLCGDGGSRFRGYIDQFRLTKGVERYTGSSYAVPTKPFPRSGP